MTAQRIAVISLLADVGHLLPSLRIAEALRSEGDTVAAFVPNELSDLPARVGGDFAVCPIGALRLGGCEPLLRRLAAAGERARALWLERAMEREYFFPLIEAGHARLGKLVEEVSAFCPTLVIADDHLFRAAYKVVAEEAGAPLLLNVAIGSHWGAQPGSRRPWSIAAPLVDPSLRLAGRLVGWLERGWRKRRVPSEVVVARARIERLSREWRDFSECASRARYRTMRVSCGVGALEAERLSHRLRLMPDVEQFGPLAPRRTEGVSPALGAWLDADPRPVTYASFGTMLPASLPVAEAVTEGARRAGFRVLWAAATAPWSFVNSLELRWEPWVNQPAVLAHERVKVFVSHAGSGAVQEAGWAGVPMLAIPMLWDQPYNAWVAEQLGLAVSLGKHGVSASSVARALDKAAQLTRSAGAVRDAFIRLDAAHALRMFVLDR